MSFQSFFDMFTRQQSAAIRKCTFGFDLASAKAYIGYLSVYIIN